MIKDQTPTKFHQPPKEVTSVRAPRTAKTPSRLSAVTNVWRIWEAATGIRLERAYATASMTGEMT